MGILVRGEEVFLSITLYMTSYDRDASALTLYILIGAVWPL